MINDVYLNGKKIECKDELKQYIQFEIKCVKCNFLFKRNVFRKQFYTIPYICQSCNKIGKNNPFYGKKHSKESKRLMGGSVVDYTGKNNPFYGKKHSKETIQILKEKCKMVGENNPFYGKKHSKETIELIQSKAKITRILNNETQIKTRIKNRGWDIDYLTKLAEDYLINHNRSSFSKKYNIDYRTIESYWFRLNLIDKDLFKQLKLYKKINSNPSKPEIDLYNLLVEKYGNDNVIHSYELNGYYYDICLFKKILVEYDGYYWHKILKNHNDSIKNRLSAENGYDLYRVEEEHNRKVNFNTHLEKIDELVKNYEINSDKKN